MEENFQRLLLDTNIYGLIVADNGFHAFHDIFENGRMKMRVYGLTVIRNELKQAPQRIIEGVNVRAALLREYSRFVAKEYPLTSLMEELALAYFQEYVQLGGSHPKEKLWNDFLIVACASIKKMDIVVSEDNATLRGEFSQKAYCKVNTPRNLALPKLIGYTQFKNLLLGTRFSHPLIDSSNKFGVLLCFFNVFPFAGLLSFHTFYLKKGLYINVS